MDDPRDETAIPTALDSLSTHARHCLASCLSALDPLWASDVGLIADPRTGHGRVRATARYALGLLVRDDEGDRDRAVEAVEAILDHQFDDPDAVYYGTWARTPAEFASAPFDDPSAYGDYDPNWREFVGATLASLHDAFEDALPGQVRDRIVAANRAATEGTLDRDVSPGYTNIALMRAFLVDWTARRVGSDAYARQATAAVEDIYELFTPHGTFCEFNSPTYTGVSLNALSQWATGTDPESALHRRGLEMEEALWRQVGEFYHAGVGQLGGPYDRSYGMDTRRSVVDYHVWLAAAGDRAPYPDSHHAGVPANYGSGILAVLGRAWRRIPDDAVDHLRSFQGERHVERTVDCGDRVRIATAWHDDRIAIGGFTSGTDGPYRETHDQLRTGTLHWRIDEATIGWGRIQKTADRRPDVRAIPGGLRVERRDQEPVRIELSAPGIDAGAIRADAWGLPGLGIDVTTNAAGATTGPGQDGHDDRVAIEYEPEHGTELVVELRVMDRD